jgi:hypothetical protein
VQLTNMGTFGPNLKHIMGNRPSSLGPIGDYLGFK